MRQGVTSSATVLAVTRTRAPKAVHAELADLDKTKDALRRAYETESNDGAKKILAMMLKSAHAAESGSRHVCSDAGVPVYFVKIGTAAKLDGAIKKTFSPWARKARKMSKNRFSAPP